MSTAKKTANLRAMQRQILRILKEPDARPAENEFALHERILKAVQDRQDRLRSAECIISQVAEDTFGEEMTPRQFADASSYDS